MFEIDRIAAVIKPTAKMLHFLNKCPSVEENINLTNLRKDCIVLLIPDFSGPKQATEYIKTIYSGIFDAELVSWGIPKEEWPSDRTLEMFKEWFDIEFHSMIYDVAYLEEKQKIA